MKQKTRLKTCMVILLSVVMMLSLSATVFATEGDTQTVETVDELKNALSAGGSITLSDDITLTEPLDISKGVTINGAGHTITDSTGALSPVFKINTSEAVVINNVTISGAARGFDLLNEVANLTLTGCTVNVSQRGVTCSLDSYDGMSLVLDNTKINNTKVTNYETEAVYDQYSRGISLWGTKNSAVTLKKGSEINGFSYCINVSGPKSDNGVADTSGLTVKVEDSTLRGWTGFNVWGSQATYTLKNSTVLGINISTGTSDNFSAITFNDDIYDQFENSHSENNILNIENSTIKNYQNGPCTEQLLRIDCGITKLNLSGTVNFVDTTGNSSTALYLAYMDDPATFLKDSVNTEGATIICTTVKDNKTVDMNFAPEYTAYYYWSDGEGGYTGVYCDFKDIFTSSAYTLYAGEYIDLLEDVALDEDVTAELEDLNEGTGSFYLNLKGHSVTGAKIILPAGVSVITDSAVNDLFAAQDGGYIISSKNEDGDTYTYQSVGVKEGNVAAIGATQYSSLSGAIKAAQTGDTITLLADIKESVAITENQNITLDLNGKTLTNEDGKDTISVDFGATLTVVGDGTVQNGTQGYAAVYNNGTAVLNGGAYTRAAEKWYTICNHGEMTINDGVTVTVASDVDSTSSMIENGYYKYSGTNSRNNYVKGTNQANPKLTINGGTFSGGLNTVKNDDGAALEITGGDFTNSDKGTSSAVIYNASKATISGGTFTSTSGKYAIFNLENNVITIGDETISTAAKVSGGTFDGKVNVASGTTMTISSGNFTAALKEAWCADTYVPTTSEVDGTTYYTVKTGEDVVSVTHVDENGNSTTQNYISLAKAVDAAETGDIITLLDNIEASEYVKISGKSLTLDLAGHTISRLTGTTGAYLLYLTSSGELTVKDSDDNQSGIVNTGDNPAAEAIYIGRNSKATIQSGTINGKTYGIYVYTNGTLEMQGGKAIGGTSGIYICNKTANAIVSGGEVTGDSYGIYNLYGTVTVKEDADITGGTYGILAGYAPTVTSNASNISTVNIDGGSITGGTAGVCMGRAAANSSLNVTGGTITGTDKETSYGIYSASAKASAISVVGGEISGANYGIYEDSTVAPTMNISNGDKDNKTTIPVITATAEAGVALKSTNCTGFVSGGRFSSEVPEEYCAEGYAPATLDEEKNQYTVKPVVATIGSGDDVQYFTSLAEAIDAAKDDDTIMVIGDVTVKKDETITIAEGVTLTINSGGALTNNGTIDVYGTLTNAESIKGQGTIKYHVQSIAINSEPLTLKIDETKILTATTNPENAVDEITWSSSDEKIATVDKNGKITAVAAGEVTITAAANNKTATCTVTISKKDAPAAPTGIAGVNETVAGKNDGKITGVSDKMEYRLKTDGDTEAWAKCTGREITGLEPGTYEIRIAETDDTEVGTIALIMIDAGSAPSYTLKITGVPTFDSVNCGYAQPNAKEITISSEGNSNATIKGVTVTTVDNKEVFVVGGSGETVTAGGSINTWTIQPKEGLPAGSYEATITVTYNNDATATATVTFTVSKKAAPAVPTDIAGVNETVQGKNDGKITGVTAEMEYRLKAEGDSGAWTICTGDGITGLAPGTYEIRIAETADTEAGEIAEVTIATGAEPTYTLNVSAPTFAAVKYGYDAPEAKAITISSTGNSDAKITNVTVSDVDGESVFEISGNGKTVSAGDSIDTWTIQPKSGLDAGAYEATITVAYNDGAKATATVSFTVSKASQSAPAVAAVKDRTYTSITLEPIADNENGAAAQYSIDGGQTWQDSNVFENLLPGIEYSFTVRYAAVDGKYTASAASEATAISTKIGTNENTVTPDDKDALTEEKQELEKALKSDAYTDEEKAMLNDRIGEIDAAFTALENAEKASDLIEALPNADAVTKDDADDINAAKAAYDKLTDHEKTLVGDEAKAKLDAAIKALAALNDDEEAVNNGSEKDDDEVIVSDASKTGDNMNLLSWSIIALTAILVAGLIVVFRRKKHINR